jgi:hypothetical protein
MKRILLILTTICCSFINNPFQKNAISPLGYDFSKPQLNVILPEVLHEISGITVIDSTTVACIQDENGILFLYDIAHFRIRKEISFGLNGDYEGITKVENTLYILRSDGVIFEIEDYTSKKLTIKEYKTGIPAYNNEGLCYDKDKNRLLIGAKGKINKDPLNKDKRFIYEFNLQTKSLNQKPLISFNVNSINLFAKQNGLVLTKKETKNGKITEVGFKLNTSEIAIHPITKKLYVLSATDHCLFICNINGELEHIEQLNPVLFNKAEGLSFFSNGDMIISNEGQAHQPTLLRFNYIPN